MKRLNPKRIPKYTEADLVKAVAEALEKAQANYKANLVAVDEEFERFERKREEISNDAQELVFLMTVVALSRKFGFGPKRLSRFFDEVNEMNQGLEDGTLTWYDIRAKADKLGFVCNNKSGMVMEMPDNYESALL